MTDVGENQEQARLDPLTGFLEFALIVVAVIVLAGVDLFLIAW